MNSIRRIRPYTGSRDADQYLAVIDRIKGRANTLIVPFLGCAGVTVNVPTDWFQYTLVNDLHREVVAFFRVLRDRRQYRDFIRMMAATEASQAALDYSSSILTGNDATVTERAWAWMVRGLLAHDKTPDDVKRPIIVTIKGSPGGNNPGRRVRQAVEICRQWRDVVRDRDWQIESREALEYIAELAGKKHAAKFFWFLDPPYHPETCDPKLYRHGVTTEWYARFLELVAGLPGAVLLCGYRHPDLDRLHAVGYEVTEFRTMAEGKTGRTEAIYWISADTPRGAWPGVAQ